MAKNRNLYLMYAIAGLQGMVFYSPIATLYRQTAGISLFEITLIESISLVLMILLELPWGIAAEKIGYKRTISFCCFLFFFSKLIFWKAHTFGGFLLERVLLAVVTAGLSGTDTAFLYRSCKKGDSHRVFGIYSNLTMGGMVAAAGLYSLFMSGRYRMSAFATAVVYGVAALLSLALQEPDQMAEGEGKEKGSPLFSLSLLPSKKLLLLILAAALFNETHQTITVFLNQPQYLRAGMAEKTMALAYIAVTLAGLSAGFSARLTSRLGAGRTGSLLLFSGGIACLILTFTCSPLLSVAAILLLRISHSLFGPLQLELQNQAVSPQNRAAALSFNAAFMDGAAVFTNLVFGRTAEISIAAAMGFGLILCLSGLLLFERYKRKPL